MKPHFHKVPITHENSFSIRHDKKPNFGTLWHFHPELELHYIVKGQGTQYIGDTVSSFSDGDLILLGENLPHTWRCSEQYFQGNEEVTVEAFVLHFSPTCFGKDFMDLPETIAITSLYERAKKGMIIYGETKEKLTAILHETVKAGQLERIINLLRILQILGTSSEYKTISPGYANSHLANISEMQRMEKIYTYVLAHYREDISLEKIAGIANLSVSSFCRYFKKMTNKTFFEFLIEIRISNVCRALVEDKLPIEVICYECGFNNVSNFYRHFNKVTGMTPFNYKKQYLI
ncbi:AraC-like DNA-binding protein [Algoriphagus ratkowskyi]|uniref:AraC-like DNA-binding protein n=1 Tax=Algoriphagus ratkowskyi TaxID=57028 RepID=A0A2W7QX32_9BACT|nr:AraC family transcriptional regulator [Algoriphagus ratkowskyi]PZX53078.1 AraC-like DNA-binding protein [Algoriphagus ratkowskyi]TXD76358.1 helix-turn-helix domain-containing protein [Algoriphagus ratkowskyi]